MSGPTAPKSWRQLLDSGFDTRLYSWDDLPTGRRRVILMESSWHRDQPGIINYLRDLDSEQCYRITVFKDRKSGRYGPPQGPDFARVRPGSILTIVIEPTRTGRFRIQSAELDESWAAPAG